MSQSDDLLAYIKQHGTVTPMDALIKLGIYRTAARVYDLRNAGHNIVTDIVETSSGARVARYWLKAPRARHRTEGCQ